MRALRFEFHPEQIRISSEEILADLRYPVRRDRERHRILEVGKRRVARIEA